MDWKFVGIFENLHVGMLDWLLNERADKFVFHCSVCSADVAVDLRGSSLQWAHSSHYGSDY